MLVRSRSFWLAFLACCLMLPLLTLSGARAAATLKTKTFKNAVYKHNFPDPFVLKVGKTYYAYGTNTTDADIPTLISKDLVHWKAGKDAMPGPPPWAKSDIWAPQVFRASKKKYVLYFAAHDSGSGRQCVGFATSTSPTGPFSSKAKKPSICQAALGGDIDPAVFQDTNGTTYVLWKNDGNCCSIVTWLWSQKVSRDGTKLLGKPVKLDYNRQDWEGNLIEAPFMWKHGKTYFLFYSANGFASFAYAVGYASCKTPLGPCTDASDNPILASKCQAAGPGGETIVTDAKGQTWMLYHAWPPSAVGDDTVGRWLWLDRLVWNHNKPVVQGPTCSSQPAPST
jgi:beta-xylosidase